MAKGPVIALELEASWAYLDLQLADKSVRIGGFGDCTDALGDLVRAALSVAARSYREVVQFDGEPGEWRMILQRDWRSPHAEALKIDILAFDDINRRRAESEGETLLSAVCAVDDFAQAVADAATAIWDAYGEDGYRERWRLAGFPLRALRALQTALTTTEAKASAGG